MSNQNSNDKCQKLEKEEFMKSGYIEMGMLNISLSEEGLDLDLKNLESYEKYLVESE